MSKPAVIPESLVHLIGPARLIDFAIEDGWVRGDDTRGIAIMNRHDDGDVQALVPVNEEFRDFRECLVRAAGIIVGYSKRRDALGELLIGVSPVHTWFELSYAQYLTVPRSVLQSMPLEWQVRFAACLDELDEEIEWRPKKGRYWVSLKNDKGRFVRDPLADYERGRRRVALRELAGVAKDGGR